MHRFISHLLDDAQKAHQKILLPEVWDERVLRAANELAEKNLCMPFLLGTQEDIAKQYAQHNILKSARVQTISVNENKSELAHLLHELRAHKGMTLEKANSLLDEPMYAACMLLKTNAIDGVVAGATHTTADTLRPALQIIKTTKVTPIASSFFLMVLDSKLMLYADCAMNIDPDAQTLASIALGSAHSAREMGIEPKIAMLSFSTKGSANHPSLQKVIDATNIVKETEPDIIIDGEIQVDAALVPSIADKKAKDSVLHGEANVLVFPDLNSGNISYKLTERLAKATAIGPIVQGLRQPVNDLSRGCSVDDIVLVSCITSIQATHGTLKTSKHHTEILA